MPADRGRKPRTPVAGPSVQEGFRKLEKQHTGKGRGSDTRGAVGPARSGEHSSEILTHRLDGTLKRIYKEAHSTGSPTFGPARGGATRASSTQDSSPAACSGVFGSRIVKQVPVPFSVSTSTLPSSSSVSCFTIERPNPLPSYSRPSPSDSC